MKIQIYYTVNMIKEIEVDDKFNALRNRRNLDLEEELYDIAEANCPENGEMYGVSCDDNEDWLIDI